MLITTFDLLSMREITFSSRALYMTCALAPKSNMGFKWRASISHPRFGMYARDPQAPRCCETYPPRNPVAPNTVAVTPEIEDW